MEIKKSFVLCDVSKTSFSSSIFYIFSFASPDFSVQSWPKLCMPYLELLRNLKEILTEPFKPKALVKHFEAATSEVQVPVQLATVPAKFNWKEGESYK